MKQDYYPLKKILNIYDNTRYEEEYKKRLNSFTTIKFPLYMNDFSTQLFAVIDLDMFNKLDSIQKKLSEIRLINAKDNQDNVFYNRYVSNLFIDELIATNEIEGVYTSRKDVSVALNYVNKNKSSRVKIRHKFLVSKYNQLINSEKLKIEIAQDIRTIYDELLNGEIDKGDLPDGKIFRKHSVTVYKRSNSSIPIHKGVMPEDAIIMQMNNLLNFLNNKNDVNILIKIAVFHYFFGYIHPFYDGNGRINRFISSYLISEYENKLLAFKLSKKIKDEIKEYDNAFIITNEKLNKGEITFFISMFIDVLEKAADEIVLELSYYEKKLENFVDVFKQDKYNLDNEEREVLFIIYQAYLCDEKVKKIDIVNTIKKSAGKTTKLLDSLATKGFINYVKKKKIEISDNALELL